MRNVDNSLTDCKSHCIQYYPIRNEDLCYTDFKSHCIQYYLMRNEDHCHTDSNSRRIQCIQWETGTTVIPNLISLYSVYPIGNDDHCHIAVSYTHLTLPTNAEV